MPQMEFGSSSSSSWDYYTLINELTQGMEQTKQLKFYLSSASTDTQHLLLQRILSSYEKALMILRWNGSSTQSGARHQAPESSVSVDGSPTNEDNNNSNNNSNNKMRDYQELRDASKKRKTQPTWTEQVRVNSENGLEGPSHDCYSWRKYGQKDILGAKYPRSYYRCTYRHLRNCWATKQVQRSDDDPTVFDVIHKGMHTCNLSANNNVVQPRPMTPEKQEMKHIYNQNNTSIQSHQANGTLMNFRASLRVDTGDSEAKDVVSSSPFSFPSTYTQMDGENHQIIPISTIDEDSILRIYSPSFVSPATSGSNYFSQLSPCQMINLGTKHHLQSSDSDLTEIISATASATNSPIAGLDFSMESIELDPNFQFNASGFFS